ncbi:hypothetical protein [Endozoicomonas sp. ONNA2]|uniref:hypothetical protein n=1 Tax=Endozoicomonas sp. ONNA2 TaxID=2828741 RepID=UPI0021493367|nr:hypothetical protein [Endozoicomonas sp. ONNA2]
MNVPHAVVDRFENLSDYLRSSEFKTNPESNIFTPLRKVNSQPAANNFLPLPYELKFEIAKHLNLKDFVAFSSINVDNYLSLREDDILVEKVLKNSQLMLVDLRKRAHESNGGRPQMYRDLWCSSLQPPPQAYTPGPAQLTCNTDTATFKVAHQNESAFFYLSLCDFATNGFIDLFFRDHICSLVIDINNSIDLKGDMMAVYYAYEFLKIALDVHDRASIEDKKNKLETLAHMIKKNQISLGKLEFCYRGGNKSDLDNWGEFLGSLRKDHH